MIAISKKYTKAITYTLLCDMLFSIAIPAYNSIYALTSGPSSPEFSSFEPVATTNLVDPLSGNFTYNLPIIQIPGPDGAGYAMSLSYHSGTSSEEEASWVGHGWTLNPGAINTTVRGNPDTYDNTPIDVYNKTRASWTMTGVKKTNLEFFSKSKDSKSKSKGGGGSGGGSEKGSIYDKPMFGLSFSKHIRYNNYQGISKTSSVGLSKRGVNLSMNRSATGVTYSAQINPFALFRKEKLRTKLKDVETKKKVIFKLTSSGASKNVASHYGLQTFTDVGQPVSLSKMKGMNVNLSYGLQINPFILPVAVEGGYTGSFSINHSIPHQSLNASGYLKSSTDDRTDHFTEKAQPFDRRDFFLGIPFSSPDNHLLSGEGLSGGFRAFADGPRAFSNKGGSSKILTYGVGIEGMIGGNVGIGVNLAFGYNESKMNAKHNLGGTAHQDISYRFYGDLGGKVAFANNNIPYVNLTANPDFPGIKQVQDNVSEVNAFQDTSTNNSIQVTTPIQKEDQGGYTITNKSGQQYAYTEPVQVRNLANLSFGINKNKDKVENNYLAYTTTYLNNKQKIDLCKQEAVSGEIKKQPYENLSLLKLITTPDYIDLGPKGPDNFDFGGWTAFQYFKKYGKNSQTGRWYRWRMPYTGLYYNQNSISDIKDDIAQVSTGEKEVNYLQKVETKTHVAYFVTNITSSGRFGVTGKQAEYLNGTYSERYDGLGAPELTADTDPASNNKAIKGTDQLEYLEKIVLFSKARPEKPLQITNFQYDYSLVQNLPNNKNGNYPNNKTSDKSGKLTLKKVWSEFEGVVSARISSYKFGYQYTKNHQTEINYALAAQNPDYAPQLLDPWGNNQYNKVGDKNNATNRHLNLITWPYQGEITKEEYDPAAWQLKQIILPSGGEILVEYESKDYQYVQDRDAMAMVRLTEAENTYTDPTYTLDLSDIGGYSDELCQKVNQYFLKGKKETDTNDNLRKRIYFKLLYALENNIPELTGCKSEYISGYAKIKNIQCADQKISITLQGKPDPSKPNYVGDGLTENPQPDTNYRLTPRQACYDYYVTQRWGKYTAGCEGKFEKKYEQAIYDDLLKCGDIGSTNLSKAIDALEYAQDGMLAIGDRAVDANFPLKENVCKTLNPQLSYLKIPMHKAKIGGGIRVKKILMYDKGIETGDQATYGQRYKYELEDGRSSGVATNEPQEMREENPLVEFMPKKDQSWLNRLIVGKDREQSEGPIGESMLPAPSVSHSRVVVENIHTGKTGTGYTVHEYFTCKDYPFDKLYDYQTLEGKDRKFDFANNQPERGVTYTTLGENMHHDKLNMPIPYFAVKMDKCWASQGFRFIQNSMHGLPKSVRTYGGTYASGNTSYISSGQDYYYYEPGEKIKQIKDFDGQNGGTYQWEVPGKEMDVTQEAYNIDNKSLNFDFEMDVSAGLTFFPPIFVTFSIQFNYNQQTLTKYATSKVIKYPAIQKKVVTYTDNIASSTENLAFDYATGQPVLTKTSDAYHGITIDDTNKKHDGSIYSLNIPAHWNYKEMGQKSDPDIQGTNQLTASAGQIITYGAGANPLNEDGTWNIKTDKVLIAEANTYATLNNVTSWINNQSVQDEYGSLGSETIYRMHESYTYKEETKKSSSRETENREIYQGGILETFTPFAYQKTNERDDKWIKIKEITKYTPNGNPVEEKDVLGIHSTAKYGYNYTLPILISKNATYNEIYFEHFEDKIATEPNLAKNNAHSGIYSKQLTSGENIIQHVKAGQLLTTTGGWLKFWTKSDQKLEEPQLQLNGKSYQPEYVAQTGEWTLYRAFLPNSTFYADQEVQITLSFKNPVVYIDDIKLTPKEAESTAYVYDAKSLRLITIFDDQHFGLFYQYNQEGQLVRKQIETEKGLKTITETQYNTPKENREKI